MKNVASGSVVTFTMSWLYPDFEHFIPSCGPTHLDPSAAVFA